MYGASQAGLTCKESLWAEWSSLIEVVAVIGRGVMTRCLAGGWFQHAAGSGARALFTTVHESDESALCRPRLLAAGSLPRLPQTRKACISRRDSGGLRSPSHARHTDRALSAPMPLQTAQAVPLLQSLPSIQTDFVV